MKRISILGATGSIGQSALRVVDHHPDRFSVAALAAGGFSEKLVSLALRYHPEFVAVANLADESKLRARLPSSIRVGGGVSALCEAAATSSSECTLLAVGGVAGLQPAVAALQAGKRLAIATKEALVAAGELLMPMAKQHGAELLPVDSEHSALFQCLEGRHPAEIHALTITASGGPFLRWEKDKLGEISVEDALRHPKWRMGPKITVDSSTLMNKGLEVIEAYHLFGIAPEKIQVVIHPESLVHGIVEFTDGAMTAHLGPTDMELPIQYALSYPERCETLATKLSLQAGVALHFEAVDHQRFPCLELAYHALQVGKSLPALMNSANEWLVAQFLAGKLPWTEIPTRLKQLMEEHQPFQPQSVEELVALHEETLHRCAELVHV